MSTSLGKLNPKEKNYIKKNLNLTIEQLASVLNQPTNIVEEYVNSISPKTELTLSKNTLLDELRNRYEYRQFKKQLTPEQLVFFESKLTEYIEQFKEDLPPSEMSNVIMLVRYELFIHEAIETRKQCLETQREAKLKLYEIDKKDIPDEKDIKTKTDLQMLFQSATTTLLDISREIKELDKSRQVILDSLKGTRKQRIQAIESSKQNYLGIIKMLQNEDLRKQHSYMNELVKIATKKVKDDLGSLHTYEDGQVDRPLLNVDTNKDAGDINAGSN